MMLSGLVFIFLSASMLVWMFFQSRVYTLSRYAVTIVKPLSEKFRILHLSDLHFTGPNASMETFFDTLAAKVYDFIFLTGDIIDCPDGIASCLVNFQNLKSKYGFFAVLGNHDYYDYRWMDLGTHNFPAQTYPRHRQDTERLTSVLRDCGVTVLRNESRRVRTGRGEVVIYGLDDATTSHADISQTFKNLKREEVNFLLTHTVDVFREMAANQVDVSFSGHSHGGQIRFPGIGPVVTHTRLGRKYASGIHRVKGAVCCVSRGLGTGRQIPFRLFCPPEAAVVTVSSSAARSAADQENSSW